MITREADYSLRTILYLAQAVNEGHPVSATALAEAMDIPYRFLRRIARRLAEGGFLVSDRGRFGGMRLSRPADQITLLDVLRVVDPRAVTLNNCTDPDADCSRKPNCPVHREMCALQALLDAHLADIRFSRLTDG